MKSLLWVLVFSFLPLSSMSGTTDYEGYQVIFDELHDLLANAEKGDRVSSALQELVENNELKGRMNDSEFYFIGIGSFLNNIIIGSRVFDEIRDQPKAKAAWPILARDKNGLLGGVVLLPQPGSGVDLGDVNLGAHGGLTGTQGAGYGPVSRGMKHGIGWGSVFSTIVKITKWFDKEVTPYQQSSWDADPDRDGKRNAWDEDDNGNGIPDVDENGNIDKSGPNCCDENYNPRWVARYEEPEKKESDQDKDKEEIVGTCEPPNVCFATSGLKNHVGQGRIFSTVAEMAQDQAVKIDESRPVGLQRGHVNTMYRASPGFEDLKPVTPRSLKRPNR